MKYIAIKSHGVEPAEKIELPRGTMVYNSIHAMMEDLKKKCSDEELTQYHCYQCEDSQITFMCGKYFTKCETTFTITIHTDHAFLVKLALYTDYGSSVKPVPTEHPKQVMLQKGKHRESNKQQTKMKFRSFAELSLPVEKE